MKRIRPAIIFAALCLLVRGEMAHAQVNAKQFIPKYVDYSSDLVVRGIYNGRKTDYSDRSRTSSDLALQEYLGVSGAGYVYAPTFITLSTGLSLGLQQEWYETANDTSYSKNATMYGFRQDLTLLPTHPYNLYLFAGRSQELVRSGTGSSSTIVFWEYGMRARYEKRPWMATLTYSHNESESTWASKTDTYGTNLYYFDTLKFLNINASYNHYESSRYDGQKNTGKDVFGTFLRKRWEDYRFLTRFDFDRQNQDDNYIYSEDLKAYTEERQRWEWHSELAVDLPYNIDSTVSYRKGHTEYQGQRGDRVTSSYNDSERYWLNLNHRLYKSLVTTVNSGYSVSESGNGATEQISLQLNSSYSKLIRWGSIGASLSGGAVETVNSGNETVLSEQHTLSSSSPTSFTLNSSTVDPDTVSVYVVDHVDNGSQVLLTRDVHYRVVQVGDSYRVIIMSLPSRLTESWTDYTYVVDYSTLGSDYTLQGTNFGGRVQATLFDRLLMPYASYSQSNQEVVEGTYPSDPNNSRSYGIGLGFNYSPFNGDVSMTWSRSDVESQDSFSSWLRYGQEVLQNTDLSCTASYEHNTILESDESSEAGINNLEEDIYSLQGQLYKSWPGWNLNGSINGVYSLYQGIGETTTRSLFSNLTWRYGRMDLSFRVSYSETDSVVADNDTNSSYSTIWFMLKRKLF